MTGPGTDGERVGAARARVVRSVDWTDTDAAGHYHHSSVIRWVEAAENDLHERLGLLDLFGSVPRVRYEVDYLDRLWFRDEVTTELWVEKVGSTSLTYAFEVTGPRGPAARGRMVCVNIGGRSGDVPSRAGVGGDEPRAGEDEGGESRSPASPWPDEVRAALSS